MTDDRPDPSVVAALRRLGAEHEPDSDAIWARVDPARAGADAPVSLDGRRDRAVRARPASRGLQGPRFTGALAAVLAAASVLGVLVVSQVLTRTDGSATPATVTSRFPSDGATPATSATAAREPAGTSSTTVGSATTTRRPSGGTASADPSPTRAVGTTPAPAGSSRAARPRR